MDGLRILQDERGDWLTVACGFCEDPLSLEDVDACLRHVTTQFTREGLNPAVGVETQRGWDGRCQSQQLGSALSTL